MNRQNAALVAGPCLFLILCAFVASPPVMAEPVALSGRAMGTTWALKFVQPAAPLDPDDVAQRVARRIEELEQQFSTYRSRSELSLFNAGAVAGEWFPVSHALVEVAVLSRELSVATDGAFDATVDPLVRLWGFGPTRQAGVPDAGEIRAARLRVDGQAIEARRSPPALRRTKPGVTVDFSSVAKGFTAGEVSALLATLGAANHLAQIGGDVKASGPGPEGKGWPVGIESPTDEAKGVAAVLRLKDHALSTSGDYRNYFIEGERRYGHIIDPRTGEPVQGACAAVSVVAPSAARASGWATALFVLGADGGLALATREGIACVFFVRTGSDQISQRRSPAFGKLQP